MPELIKSPSSGTVYLLQNGQKLPIAGPWVMEANGWNWNQVKTVPDNVVNKYPTGALLNNQPSQAPTASSGPQPGSNESIAQVIQDSTQRAYDEYFSKIKDFEAKNPFAFDEALATKVSTERINPYYDQKLGDFLQGIDTNRKRSTEDQQTVLNQIQQDTTAYEGKNKFMLDRALRQSQEGQADAGLFDSGVAKANSGEIQVDNNQNLSDYLRGQNNRIQSTNTTATRTAEDLALNQKIGTRDIGAQKQADVLTDVQKQQQDQTKKYYLGELTGVGPAPNTNPQDYQNQMMRLLGL